MKPTCDCGLTLSQCHFVHHKFTWTGLGPNHGVKLATNRLNHCMPLPTEINLYLRVLTIEGAKTVSATTHRKTNIQDWKSCSSFRATVRYTVQNVTRRFCSTRPSIKMSFKQNRSQFTSFQRSYSSTNCALLGYYAASSGNFLPTFRDDLSVPSPRFKNPKVKPDILVRALHREECGR